MTRQDYKGYSIEAFEDAPGRWFAMIKRLDGRLIRVVAGTGEPRTSITTSAARYSAADALQEAREAIDGGGMS